MIFSSWHPDFGRVPCVYDYWTRLDFGGVTQTIVKLGAVGTIPMKVPQGQEPSNRKSGEPASSKQQAPGAAAADRHTERIFLSKESMARVRDAVEHGKLLPEDATRHELRAYNK